MKGDDIAAVRKACDEIGDPTVMSTFQYGRLSEKDRKKLRKDTINQYDLDNNDRWRLRTESTHDQS